jgi:hypothetical protein
MEFYLLMQVDGVVTFIALSFLLLLIRQERKKLQRICEDLERTRKEWSEVYDDVKVRITVNEVADQ